MVGSGKNFAFKHFPKYSALILGCLKAPIVIYFAVAGNVVTFASAALFYRAELETNANVSNFLDAVWWAFCTVSTVGYGDISPETMSGRLIGAFLMVTGILFFVGFTAILVTLITSAYSEEIVEDAAQQTIQDIEPLRQEIQALREEIKNFKKGL